MKTHEVKCDECKRKRQLMWNGETWLIPTGWVAMWCDHEAVVLNSHLCEDCKPKIHKDQQDMHYVKDAP